MRNHWKTAFMLLLTVILFGFLWGTQRVVETDLFKIAGKGAFITPKGTNAERPTPSEAGMIRYSTTTGGFEGYSDTWGAIGGGGGGGGFDYPFDDYKGKAEDYLDISSFETGNNAAIQGGGTLVGTLSRSTTASEFYDTANSKAIWKYLGVAGNETNDYVCLPDITIPNSARNSGSNYLDVLVQAFYWSSFDNDQLDWDMYCSAGSSIGKLNHHLSLDVINTDYDSGGDKDLFEGGWLGKRSKGDVGDGIIWAVPSDCGTVNLCFSVKEDVDAGKFLLIDKVKVGKAAFGKVEAQAESEAVYGTTSFASPTKSTVSDTGTWSEAAGRGRFTANQKTKINCSVISHNTNQNSTGYAYAEIYLNGTRVEYQYQHDDSHNGAFTTNLSARASWNGIINKGEYIELRASTSNYPNTTTPTYYSLTATPLSNKTILTRAYFKSGDIGEISAFGSTTAPSSFLYCDGASYLRTEYQALFDKIGCNYGCADATHFNVPDLRGQFLRGQNDGSGGDPDFASRTAITTGGAVGDNVGSIQTDQLKSHLHGIKYTQHIGAGSWYNSFERVNKLGSQPILNTQNTGGNETRPKNVYVRYYIRHERDDYTRVVAVPVTAGEAVGTIISSMLTEAQFQAEKSTDWVLADGRSVAGSKYSTLTGNANLPDMRGRFLRGKNNGASGADYNPDGDSALGAFQADKTAVNSLTISQHSYRSGSSSEHHGYNGAGIFHGGPWYYNNATAYVNNHTMSGQNETSPNNVTVNYFIKIK